HPAGLPGCRPRRCLRLPRRPRYGAHRRPRAVPHPAGARRPRRHRRGAGDRPGRLAAAHGSGLPRHPRPAPARRRSGAGLARPPGAGGPPLRLAAAPPLRPARHDARQLLRAHHRRRGRRLRLRGRPHRRVLRIPLMSSPLSALYTELVIEHDKRPLHAGLREPFGAEVHHVNPTCGDEITLRLQLSDNGSRRIENYSYDAACCAMSRASASIMAYLRIGRTVYETDPVRAHFDEAMRSRGRIEGDEDLIGDGVALLGAAKFPARVKCVLMPWKAYEAALVETRALGE